MARKRFTPERARQEVVFIYARRRVRGLALRVTHEHRLTTERCEPLLYSVCIRNSRSEVVHTGKITIGRDAGRLQFIVQGMPAEDAVKWAEGEVKKVYG